ncbi:MAG: hypothetical protein IJ306_07140 [Oscillospiraceae bacterium]|nr:hypothetical protein [Oscillospiraceae bacterium]
MNNFCSSVGGLVERESGYSEEEAAGAAAEKAIVAVLMEKAEDYIGKNNPVDEVLYGSNGVIRKVDSNKIKAYNGKKLGKQEYARLEAALNTDHPNQKGYIMQILDNEKGDPAITYDVYIKDDVSMIVFGRYGGKNIHERKEYDNAHRK